VFGSIYYVLGNLAGRMDQMLSDDQLNEYRLEGTKVRVIRDNNEANDVKGIVVAWNEQSIMIRKQNRKVIEVPRHYLCQPMAEERLSVY
jgi:RNase P/RNase MRP subunit p29